MKVVVISSLILAIYLDLLLYLFDEKPRVYTKKPSSSIVTFIDNGSSTSAFGQHKFGPELCGPTLLVRLFHLVPAHILRRHLCHICVASPVLPMLRQSDTTIPESGELSLFIISPFVQPY